VKLLRRGLLILLSVAVAALPAAAAPEGCSRLVAVGDLHGGYDAFVSILRETGLLDDEGRWAGGDACLVQTGDVVDRGPRSREILDLLMRLAAEVPERVHPLLGNHEVMNVVGDLRYASVEEYAAFAAEETAEERERGYRVFLESRPDLPQGEAARRAAFDEAHPPGWFAHRGAFSPAGRYGKWLLSRPVLLKLQRTLFVHGGLSPEDSTLDVDELNRLVHRDIRSYLAAREELEADGWLDPLTSFRESFLRVERRLAAEVEAGTADGALKRARRFLTLRKNHFATPACPLWNRQLAEEDEIAFAPEVTAMLDRLDVDRIVIAHTPQTTEQVDSRFDGRVYVIDTGAGPTYGGRPSGLEIRPDGTVRAVYPGESEVLALPPPLSDAEIERFLLKGKIVQRDKIPTGISHPLKVVLELDGQRRRAVFKTIDVRLRGVVRFKGVPPERDFTDSYKYDRAAYLLDRHLGMNMVPVVVLRTLSTRRGAVVDWVEEAIDGETRRDEKLDSSDSLTLKRQMEVMELFDALIYNTDRNLGNQLITTADWRLHLIDHSRAFRTHRELPKRFERRVTRVPRALYERLGALEEKPLVELTRGVLSKGQVRALLVRRDRILEKIDGDRERLGDAAVFLEDPAGGE
jgi:hypothetical protein